MKTIRQITPVLVLLLVAACSGGSAEQTGTATATQTESAIVLGARDVVTVGTQTVAQGVRITGSLDPAERVELKAQVSGQVDEVKVERGATVRRGQLLAVIDSRTQQAQAAASRAQLTAADRDFAAAEMLFKAGAISERDYVNAKAARDAARAQLSQIGESIRRAVVSAPQNGVVTEKLVSPGATVQPGTPLFTIADITRLELAGSITADQVARIHVGDKVALTLDAYPGRVVEGRVDRIDPVADANTRQVAVYVVVPNESRVLVGGLFATGTIVSDTAATESTVAIPPGAIVDGHVYRIEGKSLHRVSASDVRSGDRIIASPSTDLHDGAVVTLTGVQS